jgi:hypothetical protein
MFQDTPNKQIIRSRWDQPILQKFKQSSQDGLTYFGMPGPQIRDFIDWKDLLSYKTAVQIVRQGVQREEDLATINKIHTNVAVKNISHVQVLRGSVEEVILKGYDMDGTAPRQSRQETSGKRIFTYDFINLDFEGGAGYKAKGGRARVSDNSGGQRIESIRKLFDRQQGHSFVFFWTVNVRDTLGDEPMQYLKEVAQRIQRQSVQEIVKWTVSLKDSGLKHYQLKTWIPLFVKEEAEGRRFYCHCYPPVFYEGFEHARMVHFAFKLDFESGRDLRVSSPQDEDRVVRLPMVETRDGELCIAATQYPGFDGAICKSELDFLDKTTKRKILNTMSSSHMAA